MNLRDMRSNGDDGSGLRHDRRPATRSKRALKSATLVAVLLVAGSLAPASPASATGVGAMLLAPWSGPPTKEVTVTASGFAPGARVSLRFDNKPAGAAVADAAGKVAAALIVPVSALPGRHPVRVTAGGGHGTTRQFLVRTNWPFPRFSHGGGGNNVYENVLSKANVGDLRMLWQASQHPESDRTTPVVVDGVVYTTDEEGGMVATDAASGKFLWGSGADDSTQAPLTVDPETGAVYFASADHFVYSVDLVTHLYRWNFETRQAMRQSPAVGGGLVYVTSDKLYAIDAVTGVQRWAYTFPNGEQGDTLSSPTLVDGVLYAAGAATFNAFDPSSGELLWSTDLGKEVLYASATPTIVGGVAYVPTLAAGPTAPGVVAVDASDGRILWSALANSVAYQPLTFGDGVVYAGDFQGRVTALRASDGTQLWQTSTGGSNGSAALANGVLYVSNPLKQLLALDQVTGEVIATVALPSASSGSPSVADGVVYVPLDTRGVGDGGLAAYAIPRG